MHLTDQPIVLGDLLGGGPDAACGAVATFTGVVRDHNQGRAVREIEYECFREMAESQLAEIARATRAQYGVTDVRVRHRVGRLAIGEVAVAIVVSAPHREEAFAACRAVIEEIKHRVPIWKKETYTDGTSEWVRCTREPAQLPAEKALRR